MQGILTTEIIDRILPLRCFFPEEKCFIHITCCVVTV